METKKGDLNNGKIKRVDVEAGRRDENTTGNNNKSDTKPDGAGKGSGTGTIKSGKGPGTAKDSGATRTGSNSGAGAGAEKINNDGKTGSDPIKKDPAKVINLDKTPLQEHETIKSKTPNPKPEKENPEIKIVDGKPEVKEKSNTPRKRIVKKGEKLDKTLVGNIDVLLQMGFGFLASTSKNNIWEISGEESKSIAEPLSKILADLGLSKKLNKYNNYIGLGLALTIVLTPRVITVINEKPKKGLEHVGSKKKINRSSERPISNEEAAKESNVSLIKTLDFESDE